MSVATDRLNGITGDVAVKAPVNAVTSANITLSGLQTIGGVALAEDDRVLVKNQTDTTANGIYNASTGDWQRARDFDGNRDAVKGTLVVTDGVSTAFLFYRLTTADPVIIGTSAITFVQASEVQDPYPRTAAEITAAVTPVNYAYPASPIIDPRRYHAGAIGVAADDLTAFNVAVLVLRQSGGAIGIPSEFSSAMTRPLLGLSNNQSGIVLDFRADRTNTGNNGFGSMDVYIEGRDSGGNYASEFRVLGKQNPALVAHSLSDGTANGYPSANSASSFLHKANGVDQWQLINDPLFKNYFNWALIHFAGGSGAYALYAGTDGNTKTRFDVTPGNFSSASKSITGATNAAPIVVTAVGHEIAGAKSPVSISGVGGNTAANGDWIVNVLTSDTFELIGSTGNGAYTSGGTAIVQAQRQRASFNVPKVQGGNEAILSEGIIVSTLAHGTAPINTQSQTGSSDLHARPYVLNVTGVQQVGGTPGAGGAKIVMGNISLAAGTATVNLSNDATFTSSGTYKVTAQDITAANAVRVTKVNGGQFTLTGTGTDSIDFIAVGF